MNLAFEALLNTLGHEQSSSEVTEVFEELGPGRRLVVQHLMYMDFFGHGISFLFDQSLRVSSIFLFAEGRDKNHFGYIGQLPDGLRFGMSRKEVREIFDLLIDQDDNCQELLDKSTNHWDKFAYEGRTIHVEYSNRDLSATMITLSGMDDITDLKNVETTYPRGIISILRCWINHMRRKKEC